MQRGPSPSCLPREEARLNTTEQPIPKIAHKYKIILYIFSTVRAVHTIRPQNAVRSEVTKGHLLACGWETEAWSWPEVGGGEGREEEKNRKRSCDSSRFLQDKEARRSRDAGFKRKTCWEKIFSFVASNMVKLLLLVFLGPARSNNSRQILTRFHYLRVCMLIIN